mmetsp:Transcript_111756/g.193702  ORF Transcript_111756/g.193702 Transcript_111756/m.193702 type:complete len:298 (+) Transcript_111756:956-1849(+)
MLHGDKRLSCSTITLSFLAEILFSRPTKLRIFMQELHVQLIGWHSSVFSLGCGCGLCLGEDENSSDDRRLVGVSPPVMVDTSGDATRERAHRRSVEPRHFRSGNPSATTLLCSEVREADAVEQPVGESESDIDDVSEVVHSFVRGASSGILVTGVSSGSALNFFKSALGSGLAGLSLGAVIKGTSHVGVSNRASSLQRFLESTETSLEESSMSSAVLAAKRHLSMLRQSYTVLASCSSCIWAETAAPSLSSEHAVSSTVGASMAPLWRLRPCRGHAARRQRSTPPKDEDGASMTLHL